MNPYHRILGHPIEDCYIFKEWVEKEYQSGEITLSQKVLLKTPREHTNTIQTLTREVWGQELYRRQQEPYLPLVCEEKEESEGEWEAVKDGGGPHPPRPLPSWKERTNHKKEADGAGPRSLKDGNGRIPQCSRGPRRRYSTVVTSSTALKPSLKDPQGAGLHSKKEIRTLQPFLYNGESQPQSKSNIQ